MEKETIEKGCFIALTLPDGRVPERLYVGVVKVVNFNSAPCYGRQGA